MNTLCPSCICLLLVISSVNLVAQSRFCQPLPPSSGPKITVGPGQASELPGIVASAESGTTILLSDGLYVITTYLRFDKANVTLRSLSGNREAVVLDGQYQGYLIQIAVSGITIADITIKRARYHLVHVVGNGHHAILHNLHLIDASQQFIKINPSGGNYCDSGIVSCSHFELTDTGRENVDPVSGGCYTGGVDGLMTYGWHIRDNLFENIYCTNGGLPTHMVLFWRSCREPLVERNTIINCARGIGFGLGSEGGFRPYPQHPTHGVPRPVGNIGCIIPNNMLF